MAVQSESFPRSVAADALAGSLRNRTVVCLGALALIASAAAQVITTVAGKEFTLPDTPLPGLSAPLGQVRHMAMDGGGNLYVADPDNDLVFQVRPDGSVTIAAGNRSEGFSGDGGLATNASLNEPWGVAVDAQGNLYIAERNSGRVRRVSRGMITTVAGGGSNANFPDGAPAGSASFGPIALAVDGAGTLYIATLTGTVLRVADGLISTLAGTSGVNAFAGDGGPAKGAKLSSPNGLAVNAQGDLFIADSGNNRVRRISRGMISTAAGSGVSGFGGDGQPATSAQLSYPVGVALDAQGNLYITSGGRVKRVANGIMTTIAGTGGIPSRGDGGAAEQAAIVSPWGVWVDPAGNLFVAESGAGKIRKVTKGIISTIAGNGRFKFSGDGGPATGANFQGPEGLAVDADGNLLIADRLNLRLRKVSGNSVRSIAGTGQLGIPQEGQSAVSADLFYPRQVAVDATGAAFLSSCNSSAVHRIVGGAFTTVAGSPNRGFSGDGGPAKLAALSRACGIALDAAGNLYIADTDNNRIRKVSNGMITTVAGNGKPGFSGDGGPAVNAQLQYPTAVAVDAQGNLYVADTDANRIRKVTGGIVTTIAGNGQYGFSGDGGPATAAALRNPSGVAVDAAGNVYIADPFNHRVRRVKGGIITTFAGTGVADFDGDGDPAVEAALDTPSGVAVDAAGNVYIADTGNDRIRKVLVSAPSFQVSTAKVSFAGQSGGATPGAAGVSLSATAKGLKYSVSSSAAWLTTSPLSGSIPGTVAITADPAQLTAGTYTAKLTVAVAEAVPSTQTVDVSLTVAAGTPGQLAVNAQSLPFSVTQGSEGVLQLAISNVGGAAVPYAASASTATGGNWLQVSPAAGSVTASAPASVTVTAKAGSLAVGTYRGTVTITNADSGQSIAIPVSFAVSAPVQRLLLSHSGLAFTAVSGGGAPLPQSIGILNTAQGAMGWTATATTLSGGSSWLRIDSASGMVNAPTDVSLVNVSVDASSLAPGDYYGLVQVRAPSASNGVQSITVVLSVQAAGSNPGLEVRPTGLIFTGVAGATPGSQEIRLANLTADSVTYESGVIGSGLKIRPTNAAVLPNQPAVVYVYADFKSLKTGTVNQGTITLQLSDLSPPRTVQVLMVVAPDGTAAEPASGFASHREAAGCASTKLIPLFTQVGGLSSVPAGWPATITAQVVDDCGSAMDGGEVVVSFTNGDVPQSLKNLTGGKWTTTWTPLRASSSAVGLAIAAKSGSLSGKATASTAVQGSKAPPLLSTGPVSAGTRLPGALAPGEVILFQGSGLARGPAKAGAAVQELGGATTVIGGELASILYAADDLLVGIVPFSLPANTSQQAVMTRDDTVGTPVSLLISATHPALLTADGSGQGQGVVYRAAGGPATALADALNGAPIGEAILIYTTGLGAVDAQGAVANAVSVTIGGQPAQVTYAGLARAANYPAAGAPSLLGGLVPGNLGGLYEIALAIPAGVAGGAAEVVVESAGQTSQSGVTVYVSAGEMLARRRR